MKTVKSNIKEKPKQLSRLKKVIFAILILTCYDIPITYESINHIV